MLSVSATEIQQGCLVIATGVILTGEKKMKKGEHGSSSACSECWLCQSWNMPTQEKDFGKSKPDFSSVSAKWHTIKINGEMRPVAATWNNIYLVQFISLESRWAIYQDYILQSGTKSAWRRATKPAMFRFHVSKYLCSIFPLQEGKGQYR